MLNEQCVFITNPEMQFIGLLEYVLDRVSVREFRRAAKERLHKVLFARDREKSPLIAKQTTAHYPVIEEHDAPDTCVFPLVQAAPFGINVDHEVTASFLKRCESGSQVVLASAYFNLTPSYMETILKSQAKYRIYTASPSASVLALSLLF